MVPWSEYGVGTQRGSGWRKWDKREEKLSSTSEDNNIDKKKTQF